MYCIPTIGGELHINSIDVYLKGTLRVTAITYHDASDVSIVSKNTESPVRCALCQGSHSANYKDSSVHKKLNYIPPRLEISFLPQQLI
ncbi:PRE C2HC domain-containing protein [Aphis craccivora]|uniref:PRE C2HC domain-containing protein n=1 Tax=Aphis craccivora TaxID=307492 RepID=A0A6G0YWA4_APHCR|nr:PRE C2HC domain-containing protein [Aphis craccivora]